MTSPGEVCVTTRRRSRCAPLSWQQIASSGASIRSGIWHTLEATATGDTLTVSWDGEQLMSKRDTTFARGKIGLWTKVDSVTAFDDLEAEAR